MILYHFLNADYGLKGIKKRRLKISRIMELNDPFEFFGVDRSDPNFRQALNTTKKQMSKNHGILCFSETWTNPVLWGHYADKHRGICLGFEVPRYIPGKINYVDSPLARPAKLDLCFMKKLLHTKFLHWQYEKEYRIWVSLEEKNGDLYYAKFSDVEITLTHVIIGLESSVTRSEVSDALGDLADSVEISKAREDFKSFKVIRNKGHNLDT